jgi:hypothetical protein
MKENELVAMVTKKELKEFTHNIALDWAAYKLTALSNILYTILAGTPDIKDNEKLMSRLATANECLIRAIDATGGEYKNKIVELPNDGLLCREVRDLIDKKNKVCDFMTLEIKEHDKMSGRTDKMADFVKVFFTELDKFEEELYNVI